MNIGGTEVILILVVALLLFGAKNLPKIARSFGRTTEHMRKAVQEVKAEIMRADVDAPPPPTPLPALKPAAHLEQKAVSNQGKPDEPAAG